MKLKNFRVAAVKQQRAPARTRCTIVQVSSEALWHSEEGIYMRFTVSDVADTIATQPRQHIECVSRPYAS